MIYISRAAPILLGAKITLINTFCKKICWEVETNKRYGFHYCMRSTSNRHLYCHCIVPFIISKTSIMVCVQRNAAINLNRISSLIELCGSREIHLSLILFGYIHKNSICFCPVTDKIMVKNKRRRKIKSTEIKKGSI